ncbi:hypothetical protein GDO81_019609 [Engystomops pustulosus]|uniref:Uncharacterized protein n=1 Tax=Engystomops pustulosus TaxID=76066 RepID=A0AAV6ZXL4_ENGPU|nr:hypothetical protein GDO81_019609 [Engystomops pustulosus]
MSVFGVSSALPHWLVVNDVGSWFMLTGRGSRGLAEKRRLRIGRAVGHR